MTKANNQKSLFLKAAALSVFYAIQPHIVKKLNYLCDYFEHMYRMKKLIYTFTLLAVSLLHTKAEGNVSLYPPLKIPAVLAGNFGELRPNHFHSGIDFKTQGRTGLNIYCADDGYVSRVLVSPWGFGRAVYVVHPGCGLTTVYGHLMAFSSKIDKIVRAKQYEQETFTIDIEFEPGEIPVKRGEVIALSGNAGSSAGPHLHMDVRDTETGDPLDPMVYYKSLFKDTTKPEVRELALFPTDSGVVNGGTKPVIISTKEASHDFEAWGNVIPGITAYDRMDGTTNIYGVKYMTFEVDGETVYSRTVDRFSFDDTRAVNTLAEYGGVTAGKWRMWTYIPPSQPLSYMIKAENSGIITIDEERDYKCAFTLKDEFGNTTVKRFTIRGVPCEIPSCGMKGVKLDYNGSHSYNVDGVKVALPAGVLYDDIDFEVKQASSCDYLSNIITIGNIADPLASNIDIEIPIAHDTIPDKSKYCLVYLKGNRRSAVAAKYSNSKMCAKVNRFGKYAVTTDVSAPKITPVNKAKWAVRGIVTLKISDNLSGIETYRCELDGKFALFELDGKTGQISFKLDSSRFKKGRNHTLKVVVTDACGNCNTQTYKFKW